jgi:FdrA protein
LFCGGTTGAEALVLLGRAGLQVHSNLHKKGELKIAGTEELGGHVLLDLGDDVFTQGRPHPMIEPALRNERLAVELEDPAVGLLLFDLVLGHGSHDDPAGVLVDGVRDALATRKHLAAIASITGTDGDPQGFATQRQKLVDAGIVVMPDNRWASLLAAAVLAPRAAKPRKPAKRAARGPQPRKKSGAASARRGDRR